MKPKSNIYLQISLLAFVLIALSSCMGGHSVTRTNWPSQQLESQMAYNQNQAAIQNMPAQAVARVSQAEAVQPKAAAPVAVASKPKVSLSQKIVKATDKLASSKMAVTFHSPIQTAIMRHVPKVHLEETPAPTDRKMDWVGIAALAMVIAAYLSFFVFKAYILSGILLVAGIITGIRGLRRCEDRSKYKGKAFPRIAVILGGIGFVLVLLFMAGLAIAVSQVE